MAKTAIPNLFTFGNLVFGILSLIMSFEDKYLYAGVFILIAGLMDRYDGRVARFLQVSSDLGKELDSLADLVSFGVAPSILIFTMYDFLKFGALGYLLVLIFPVAGAYRLARYNCSTFNNVFTGIPITFAGSIVALYSLLTMNSVSQSQSNLQLIITIVLMLMLSYLMISKLKFKKV